MSLKHPVLIVFLIALSFPGFAQLSFHTVTAADSQSQVFAAVGNTVAANSVGTGSCKGKHIPAPGVCNVVPYHIGDCGPNAWMYSFAVSVTHIRLHITSMNQDDTIKISIPYTNPQQIVITNTQLTSWSSACTPSVFAAFATSDGYITGDTIGSGDHSDLRVDIQNPNPPYSFSKIKIEHIRSAGNTSSDGVVYQLFFGVGSTAVGLLDTEGDVKIYPNPASDKVYIENAGKGARVQLVDVFGRELYSSAIADNKQEISTANLPVGTYLLQLTRADGTKSVHRVLKN